MAQTTRITEDIIVNALYLIGELGVGETPDAFMLSTGLEIVNELLDKFSADSIYVPFLKTLTFTMVPGQDIYSVSDIAPATIVSDRIIDLSFANYKVQGNIEYPIRIVNKATFFGIVRLTNPVLQARPGLCYLDKQDTISYIQFYAAPDQPYICSLKVKQMIDKLEAQENIDELPPFYYGFMKYAVARKFIAYYPSANWPQTAEDEYQDYFSTIKNANETDVTIRPSSILDKPEPYYWQNILAY